MAAPSFIQERETAWNSTTSKTTASFDVLAGDVLATIGVAEHFETGSVGSNLTISGGSLTWTPQQTVEAFAYSKVVIWTAIVDSNKSMTVAIDETGSAGVYWFGGNVLTFRGSDGVGASSKTNVSSGAPTLNLTTTQDNSAIVVVNGDWNAVDGASRTWRANAGAFTEQSYFRDSSRYTLYGGYHADAGVIGTYAVGLSAPGSQKYAIAAVEIKGTAGGGGGSIVPIVMQLAT